LAEALDVAILNMTAITPQMGDDPAGACALANPRGYKQIRLGVLRLRHCGISRLPQCRNVIDVHSQTQTHRAK
jgi:hypothetical protein